MNHKDEVIKRLVEYDPSTGYLVWRASGGGRAEVGGRVGTLGKEGYRHTMIGGYRQLAHRVVWFLHYGEWPSHRIWHINGNRDGNRIENLAASAEPSNEVISKDRLYHLLIYDAATGIFTWRVNQGRIEAGTVAGNRNPNGYWVIMIDRRLYLAHRLAWLYSFGKWPTETVDHINRVRSDNRLSNLRAATSSENCCNSPPKRKNASGKQGANYDPRRGKYRVRVTVRGRRREIGFYDTVEEAHAAYLRAVAEMHGEFAHLPELLN